MSDIAFYGVGSFFLGLVFLALAVLLTLIAVGVSVANRVRKRPLLSPGVLGLVASTVVLCACGGFALFAAEEWPRGADDTALLWGPATLIATLVAGVAAGALSKKSGAQAHGRE